jgi:anti-sigma B factor antagonist
MAAATRIDARDVDTVKVLRFQDKQLFDERTVREVADQIAAALPNDGSPIRVVLDFSDVALVSSSLLSKLILLQRRVDASHGKLRLCEMSPVLQSVFRTANLDRLFSINRDLREALAAFD